MYVVEYLIKNVMEIFFHSVHKIEKTVNFGFKTYFLFGKNRLIENQKFIWVPE